MQPAAGRLSIDGNTAPPPEISQLLFKERRPASGMAGTTVDRVVDDVQRTQHDHSTPCDCRVYDHNHHYGDRNRQGHDGDDDDMCPFADRVRCRLHLGDLRALDAMVRNDAAHQARWCVVTVLSERDLDGLALPRHVDAHHIIIAEDDLGVDLTPAFAPAHDVITLAMARGKSVLVHCMGGISRSTTILAAHLILQEGLTASEAMTVIRKVRRRAGPNASFWQQLRDLAAKVTRVSSALSPPPPPLPPATADAGHA
ncbi:Protein tyrosine phosphatase incomplete domain containing protein [Pandoravirus macleodensis]|uniref:Protein tyrosine phosphatase incomplete domain containing protein n=1 Tax=Pandoravirus macleodensis TaxID=2107707 RepID=A0A2U7UGS6_9VIRU|nr:Protein tyrosine phosphatase incomplete domain containing protein [Pandoravirus macleodensis]AVK77231.1 Protein tyrosine phosphatase incomplete domain containing protein [Pandoravirus macleodensis]UMO79961.1 Protein tyrosine phosphatase incomplete domain containing protein [Pandoravirus aubagnensis]